MGKKKKHQDHFGIIYKIKNKINGKIYIGQTVQVLKERWWQHCNCDKYAIGKAISKYGRENFEIIVISYCNNIEEMNHRESYYIKLYNSQNPNGYNLNTGGDGFVMSEETKKKISEANKGRVKTEEELRKIAASNTGVKFTEERKRNISKALKGKTVPYERRVRTSNTLKGRAPWNIGLKLSELHKKKVSEGLKNSKLVAKQKKKVICIENGKEYESISDAAREIGSSSGKICALLKGKVKSIKGFTFKRI